MAQDWLTELALAIADGKPIDWAAHEARSLPESERKILARLRFVEQIVHGHGVANASVDGTSSPRHSLRADDTEAADGAPLEWGPLTILERIGGGGYGDVYRARDRRLDRDVALKLLKRRPARDDSKDDATINEARLLARVRHPNVVTVHGAESIGGRVGLWMELLDGVTLAEEVAVAPLSPKSVAEIGIDLCGALEAAHKAGVLHHDLKAQNVIRTKDGRIVLTDFGAGRTAADGQNGGGRRVAGTPAYLAPEVLRGEPATVQSEIYSLGVLLAHLLTGGWPTADLPGAPPRLAAILHRCLSPEPTHRFGRMSEVQGAIKAYISSEWPRPSQGDQLVGALSRTVRAVVILMALSGLCGFLASYAVEPEYRSYGVIKMRPAWISPTAVGGEDFVRLPEMSSISERVLTRTRIERIIVELNVRSPALASRLMQDQVEYVRRRVEISPTQPEPLDEGTEFTIAFSWSSPEVAKRVTERLVGTYMDEYQRLRDTLSRGRLDFVQAQVSEVNERLERLKATARKDMTIQQAMDFESLTLRQRELSAIVERVRVTNSIDFRRIGPQIEQVDPPRLPTRPYRPDRFRYALIGMSIGLVPGLLVSGVRTTRGRKRALISLA